jgi:hypothetical protein
MARLSGKLANLHCRTAPAGVHSDGGGLYLQVREGKARQGVASLTASWSNQTLSVMLMLRPCRGSAEADRVAVVELDSQRG